MTSFFISGMFGISLNLQFFLWWHCLLGFLSRTKQYQGWCVDSLTVHCSCLEIAILFVVALQRVYYLNNPVKSHNIWFALYSPDSKLFVIHHRRKKDLPMMIHSTMAYNFHKHKHQMHVSYL